MVQATEARERNDLAELGRLHGHVGEDEASALQAKDHEDVED